MPGFSFLMALVMGLGAWGLRPLSNTAVGGGLLAGVGLSAVAVTAESGWVLNVGQLSAALFLGVAIGRILPPRPTPMLAMLLMLSMADFIWIGYLGGSATGLVGEISNFSVGVATSSSTIGVGDLVLAASATTHWLRRGSRILLALAPAPIGMVASNIYILLTSTDNLPLVPFITLGWLATEAWHHRTERTRRTSA